MFLDDAIKINKEHFPLRAFQQVQYNDNYSLVIVVLLVKSSMIEAIFVAGKFVEP